MRSRHKTFALFAGVRNVRRCKNFFTTRCKNFFTTCGQIFFTSLPLIDQGEVYKEPTVVGITKKKHEIT